MEKAISKKYFTFIIGAVIFAAFIMVNTLTAQAVPQYGFGRDDGRTDTVNENDYHTNQWDRFSYNYIFVSGSDYYYVFGNPTIYDGFVPVNVYAVNMRRDANVSLRPPAYGIYSGHIPTSPSNYLFPQPVNPNYYQVFILDDPNTHPQYDTLQLGVNAAPVNSPSNVQQNTGTGQFLPPTSIQ